MSGGGDSDIYGYEKRLEGAFRALDGSRMTATYIHLSGQDLDEKLESLHEGRVLKPPKVEFTPVL